MKWVADIIPFLEPYPAWVKGLVSGWVLFTAVCVVALAFGTYPSIGGAEWVMTGPDMSPELFKLPPSEVFEITFSLTANEAFRSAFQGPPKTTEFISQRTIVVRRDELPYTGQYAVHELGTEGTRSAGIAATISFSLSKKPD